MTETRVIHSLSELTTPQVQAVLKKAKVKMTGSFTPPPLDMEAIKRRASDVEQGPLRNDLYRLICEVEIMQRKLIEE